MQAVAPEHLRARTILHREDEGARRRERPQPRLQVEEHERHRGGGGEGREDRAHQRSSPGGFLRLAGGFDFRGRGRTGDGRAAPTRPAGDRVGSSRRGLARGVRVLRGDGVRAGHRWGLRGSGVRTFRRSDVGGRVGVGRRGREQGGELSAERRAHEGEHLGEGGGDGHVHGALHVGAEHQRARVQRGDGPRARARASWSPRARARGRARQPGGAAKCSSAAGVRAIVRGVRWGRAGAASRCAAAGLLLVFIVGASDACRRTEVDA